MNDAPQQPRPIDFQQRIGLFDATMLIMGTMIGSGIFVVSAGIAQDVGSSGWLLAVWVATGVMTILGALSYAELAGMMPHAGGQYVFLREAYSPLPGFLYGWVCFLIIQTGSIAAVAVVFAKYLGVFLPQLSGHLFGPVPVKWKVSLPLPWRDDRLVVFERTEFAITYGQLVAVGIIALLTLLNCLGVREGKLVQNAMTVTKTLALALLILLGLTLALNADSIEQNTAQPWQGIETTAKFKKVSEEMPGGSPLLVMLMVAGAAMTGSLFAADAWNNITFAAGEIKNPRRTLPLSLALGTGSVIILYLLANLAYMAVLPVRGDAELAEKLKQEAKEAETAPNPTEAKAKVEADYRAATHKLGIADARDERVGTAVFQQVSPHFGVPFMALAIMISTFGCVNGMILLGARLYYAMAKDHLFFSSAGLLNRRGVPAVGLIVQGIWSILLVFSGSYDELVDFVMFTVFLFYLLTVIGLFILRYRQPGAERPYRALGYPVLPGLYVLGCAAICVVLLIVKPENAWPGLILTLAGIPVYFFWRWRGRAAANS